LIDRLRKGDNRFQEIYARYSDRLTRADDAEDRRRGELSRKYLPGNKVTRMIPIAIDWIANIARSRSIDKLRTSYREQTTELNEERVNSKSDFSRIIEDREESRKIIREALDSLPDNQRIAIEMVFFEGLTHIEAAERLNEPVGTIKTRIRLGVSKLKEKISPYVGDLL
jgi:RNA polymerase sigma-70 factor (ECF subfamily)